MDISPNRDWILVETDTLSPNNEPLKYTESYFRRMQRYGMDNVLDRVEEVHRVMVTSDFEGAVGDRIRIDSDNFYTVNYFFDNILQHCRHVSKSDDYSENLELN